MEGFDNSHSLLVNSLLNCERGNYYYYYYWGGTKSTRYCGHFWPREEINSNMLSLRETAGRMIGTFQLEEECSRLVII
jgi:hypothetical protein